MIAGNTKKIYLIGICGTAMASLAGLLKEKGFEVLGSDSNVYPPMSTQLQSLGIRLFSGYKPENLKASVPDLVIPGNAVPRGNPELEEMLNQRLPYISLPEAIKEFFLRDKLSIVVAGTHGKTSTTSIVAWLLSSAGLSPSFLVGGIPLNFGKSFEWNSDGKFFVIEGDEYDTGFMDRRPKFVQYLPEIVLLNSVEYDHADLYPDMAAVENAFWQLLKVVPGNGQIIVSRDSEAAFALAKKGYSKVISYGWHPESDYRIHSENWKEGTATFHLNEETYSVQSFGRHNIGNSCAGIILGKQLGLKNDQIERGLKTFQGVKRRMELRGEVGGIAVYDDFAHHPTAIHSTLEGVRLAFGKRRVWGIFEPRSWSSRRNVFQKEFARAFTKADIAIIAGVFEPEKVPVDLRLNPAELIQDMKKNGPAESYYIADSDELLEFVIARAQPGDKLILMSNGSFEGLHDKILKRLEERS